GAAGDARPRRRAAPRAGCGRRGRPRAGPRRARRSRRPRRRPPPGRRRRPWAAPRWAWWPPGSRRRGGRATSQAQALPVPRDLLEHLVEGPVGQLVGGRRQRALDDVDQRLVDELTVLARGAVLQVVEDGDLGDPAVGVD